MSLAYPPHKREYKEELCRSEEDLISSNSCLMHIGYTVPSVLCTFSLSMEKKELTFVLFLYFPTGVRENKLKDHARTMIFGNSCPTGPI